MEKKRERETHPHDTYPLTPNRSVELGNVPVTCQRSDLFSPFADPLHGHHNIAIGGKGEEADMSRAPTFSPSTVPKARCGA